jgi:copper chaperone CopZ
MSAAAERTYVVDGMSCEHCRKAITGAVGLVPGISGVEVDLERGTVLVRGAGADDASVRAAIDAAGYGVRP